MNKFFAFFTPEAFAERGRVRERRKLAAELSGLLLDLQYINNRQPLILQRFAELDQEQLSADMAATRAASRAQGNERKPLEVKLPERDWGTPDTILVSGTDSPEAQIAAMERIEALLGRDRPEPNYVFCSCDAEAMKPDLGNRRFAIYGENSTEFKKAVGRHTARVLESSGSGHPQQIPKQADIDPTLNAALNRGPR